MPATLGERIRQLRERRGLTQAELVAEASLSSSYVSLIESGRRQPKQRVLELIADRLDCTVDYLRTGKGDERAQDLVLELRFAEVALRAGDAATARERFELTGQRAQELELDDLRHEALWGRSRADEALGDLAGAIEGFLALSQEPDLAVSRVSLMTALSRAHRECGDLSRAVEIGEAALAEATSNGARPLEGDEVAELASTLVSTYYERGDLMLAHVLINKVVSGTERAGSTRARAAAYWSAGLVADARGDRRAARSYTERALALYSEGDNARATALLRLNLAWVILRSPEPDLEQARGLLERALEALPEVGTPLDIAQVETELARCDVLDGRPDRAVAVATRALERLAPGPRLEAARARAVLGDAQLSLGDVPTAAASYAAAADELAHLGAHRHAAEVWCELADAMAGLGLAAQAIDAYRQAAAAGGLVSRPRHARYVTSPVLGSVDGSVNGSKGSTGSVGRQVAAAGARPAAPGGSGD